MAIATKEWVLDLLNKYHERNAPVEFKDITSDFDSGKFSNNLTKYKPGNYIKKGNYLIMLADYDTYYGGYDSYATVNTHHWCAMVFGCGTHNMNASNTTVGGYKSSSMNDWLKNTVMPELQTIFGDTHFLSHQKLLSGGYDAASWESNMFIELPSEIQIYGTKIWSNNGFTSGNSIKHLELFKHNSFMEVFKK